MRINTLAFKHWVWVDLMGWHNKSTLESLALVASEVGEAINECRGTSHTDNLSEELADIILRVLDLGHTLGFDMESKLEEKVNLNMLRGNRGRVK